MKYYEERLNELLRDEIDTFRGKKSRSAPHFRENALTLQPKRKLGQGLGQNFSICIITSLHIGSGT